MYQTSGSGWLHLQPFFTTMFWFQGLDPAIMLNDTGYCKLTFYLLTDTKSAVCNLCDAQI